MFPFIYWSYFKRKGFTFIDNFLSKDTIFYINNEIWKKRLWGRWSGLGWGPGHSGAPAPAPLLCPLCRGRSETPLLCDSLRRRHTAQPWSGRGYTGHWASHRKLRGSDLSTLVTCHVLWAVMWDCDTCDTLCDDNPVMTLPWVGPFKSYQTETLETNFSSPSVINDSGQRPCY